MVGEVREKGKDGEEGEEGDEGDEGEEVINEEDGMRILRTFSRKLWSSSNIVRFWREGKAWKIVLTGSKGPYLGSRTKPSSRSIGDGKPVRNFVSVCSASVPELLGMSPVRLSLRREGRCVSWKRASSQILPREDHSSHSRR